MCALPCRSCARRSPPFEPPVRGSSGNSGFCPPRSIRQTLLATSCDACNSIQEDSKCVGRRGEQHLQGPTPAPPEPPAPAGSIPIPRDNFPRPSTPNPYTVTFVQSSVIMLAATQPVLGTFKPLYGPTGGSFRPSTRLKIGARLTFSVNAHTATDLQFEYSY